MTSPTFDVSGLSSPVLWFDWSHSYSATYPNDELDVLVSDDNGANWTSVWNKVGTDLESNDGVGNTTPGSFISSGVIDLSAFGTSLLVRFNAISGYGPDLFVDNVTVEEASAAATTWTGATDIDWQVAANWSDGVPGPGTDVIIPAGMPNYPTVSVISRCNNLTISSTATGDGSLIENGFLQVNGTVTAERYVSNGQWHGISSPVAGATAQSLYSNTANVYLKSHAEATNDYTNITALTDPLGDMQGFMMWYAGAATGESFGITGTLRNATVGSAGNMERTGADDAFAEDYYGWNFVGNPYSSAIDWNAAAGWDKTGLGAAIYLYNNGLWNTWNGAAGTNGQTQYIAMGQGFFVNVTDATPGTYPQTGTLTMTNDVQVHNSVGYLKSSFELDNIVRLEVSNGEYTDDAVIYFEETATEGFDAQFDAHKLFSFNGNKPLIYSTANNFMAINVLPIEIAEVPVDVTGVNGENMTITATEVIGFGDVFLLDNYTGVQTNITQENYTFEYNEGITNRFVVFFTMVSVNENSDELITIYSHDNNVRVIIPEDTNAEIAIYNLMGQKMSQTTAHKGINNIPVYHTGYYLVKVMDNDNVVTKKIFIK